MAETRFKQMETEMRIDVKHTGDMLGNSMGRRAIDRAHTRNRGMSGNSGSSGPSLLWLLLLWCAGIRTWSHPLGPDSAQYFLLPLIKNKPGSWGSRLVSVRLCQEFSLGPASRGEGALTEKHSCCGPVCGSWVICQGKRTTVPWKNYFTTPTTEMPNVPAKT